MVYVYPDHVRDDILRMIPPDGKVIGSIGCGYAGTEAVLVQQGREVHGVDTAPQAITVAQQRLTSARVIVPGERYFAPASLDGLILADVLEHIPRAWEALAAFAQAVHPGGWMVISVPNMRNLDAFRQYALRGDWPEDEQGIFDATHLQFMTAKRLTRWCSQAGLVTEQWFDKLDSRHPRRNKYTQVFDDLTLHYFHTWFQFQLQVRCRKSGGK